MLAGFSVGESVTLMSGIAVAGVVIGLGGVYLEISDLILAVMFLVGGILYYSIIRRAWRVMRFLRRSICRRSEVFRRASERRDAGESDYDGPERRTGTDRRQLAVRRAGDDKV
jgi:hypothetical protein